MEKSQVRVPYTFEEVDAAEARIKSECSEEVTTGRSDYGWRLSAVTKTPRGLLRFMVYWHDEYGTIYIGDLDRIIAALNNAQAENSVASSV